MLNTWEKAFVDHCTTFATRLQRVRRAKDPKVEDITGA